MNQIDQLAVSVEHALNTYIGDDNPPTATYADLAASFAALVHAAHVGPPCSSPRDVAVAAQELTQRIAGFVESLSAIVE